MCARVRVHTRMCMHMHTHTHVHSHTQADGTPTAVLSSGLAYCATSVWTSDTSLNCATGVNPGAGAVQSSVVTVQAVVGTRVRGFTWDAPSLSFEATANVARTGGTAVTLTGMNFVEVDLTPTAYMAMYLTEDMISSASWSSATTIVAKISNAPTGHIPKMAALTVSAVVGTRIGQWSFDSPVLSQAPVAVSNAATSGGSTVTISGLNFGYHTATPTATMNDAACSTTAWSSATTVQCSGAAGSGPAVQATLSVAATVGTRLNVFSFDAPVVSFMADG